MLTFGTDIFLFTPHNSQEIHLGCCIYQYFQPVIAEQYFMVWMYHRLFNHSLIKGHLDCFQFLSIMDKATVNIYIQVFFVCKHVFLSPGYPARRLLTHMVTLQEITKLFSKMAISFCIPTRSLRTFPTALYSSQRLVLSVLKYQCCNRGRELFHCGFSLVLKC